MLFSDFRFPTKRGRGAARAARFASTFASTTLVAAAFGFAPSLALSAPDSPTSVYRADSSPTGAPSTVGSAPQIGADADLDARSANALSAASGSNGSNVSNGASSASGSSAASGSLADNPFAVDLSKIGTDADLDARSANYFARFDKERRDGATAKNGESRASRPSKGLFGYEVETDAGPGDSFYERWVQAESSAEIWRPQVLPQGVMYASYLADPKEARLASDLVYDDQYGGALWEATLGGRVPLFRFGTTDVVRPEGWELEVEGAARLRFDLDRDRALAANEFRFGLPIVYGTRRWQFKTGYSRVDSRLAEGGSSSGFASGLSPSRARDRKYSRDSIMFGLAFKPVSDVRLYAETDVAFGREGAAEPLELLFGAEYSPQFNPNFPQNAARPFFATSARLLQERDFGGYWSTQTGAQWRSESNGLLRAGVELLIGNDDVYRFQDRFQRKYGFGLWYDF